MLPTWAGRILVCSLEDGRVKVWGAFHSWDWIGEGHAVHIRRTSGRPVWVEEQGRPVVMPEQPRAFSSYRR